MLYPVTDQSPESGILSAASAPEDPDLISHAPGLRGMSWTPRMPIEKPTNPVAPVGIVQWTPRTILVWKVVGVIRGLAGVVPGGIATVNS